MLSHVKHQKETLSMLQQAGVSAAELRVLATDIAEAERQVQLAMDAEVEQEARVAAARAREARAAAAAAAVAIRYAEARPEGGWLAQTRSAQRRVRPGKDAEDGHSTPLMKTPGSVMSGLLSSGTILSELLAYLHLYVSHERRVTEPLFVLNEGHIGLVGELEMDTDQLWRTVVKGLLSDVSSCGHFASTVQTCVYGFVDDESVKGPGSGGDSVRVDDKAASSPLGLLQWLLRDIDTRGVSSIRVDRGGGDHKDDNCVILLRCAYECRDASTNEREDSHVFLIELRRRDFLGGLTSRETRTVETSQQDSEQDPPPVTAESLFATHASRSRSEGLSVDSTDMPPSRHCGFLLQSEERRYDCSVKPANATDIVWILAQLQRYHSEAVVSAEDMSEFIEFTSVDVPLCGARPTRLVNTGPYVGPYGDKQSLLSCGTVSTSLPQFNAWIIDPQRSVARLETHMAACFDPTGALIQKVPFGPGWSSGGQRDTVATVGGHITFARLLELVRDMEADTEKYAATGGSPCDGVALLTVSEEAVDRALLDANKEE